MVPHCGSALTYPTGNSALSTGTEASSPRPQRPLSSLSVVKDAWWSVKYASMHHDQSQCSSHIPPTSSPCCYPPTPNPHTTHTYKLTRRQVEVNTVSNKWGKEHHPLLIQAKPFLRHTRHRLFSLLQVLKKKCVCTQSLHSQVSTIFTMQYSSSWPAPLSNAVQKIYPIRTLCSIWARTCLNGKFIPWSRYSPYKFLSLFVSCSRWTIAHTIWTWIKVIAQVRLVTGGPGCICSRAGTTSRLVSQSGLSFFWGLCHLLCSAFDWLTHHQMIHSLFSDKGALNVLRAQTLFNTHL